MATLSKSLQTIVFKPTQSGGTYPNSSCTVVQSWTVPDDWNDRNNILHVIGGGGGGAIPATSYGGAGGGGGAYANTVNISVTPGSTIYFQIGAGGSGATSLSTSGGSGSNTWVAVVSTQSALTSATQGAKANGGFGGTGTNAGAGGSGGLTAASIGSFTAAGGRGGAANNTQHSGGAGGGSAGSLTGSGFWGGTPASSGSSGGAGGGGVSANGVNSTSTVAGTGGAGSAFGGGGNSGGAGDADPNGIGGNGLQGNVSTRFTDSTSGATAGSGGGGGGGGGAGGSGGGTSSGDGGLGGWHGGGGGGVGGSARSGGQSLLAGFGGDGLVVIQYTPTWLYANAGSYVLGANGATGSVNTNTYFANNAGKSSGARVRAWWANTSTLRNQANTSGSATVKIILVKTWNANTSTLSNRVTANGTVSGPSSKLSAFIRNYIAANSELGNIVSTESYYPYGNRPYARGWVHNTKADYYTLQPSGAAFTQKLNLREWSISDTILGQSINDRSTWLPQVGGKATISKQFAVGICSDTELENKSISGGVSLNTTVTITETNITLPYYYFSNVTDGESSGGVVTGGFIVGAIQGKYALVKAAKIEGLINVLGSASISAEFNYFKQLIPVNVTGAANILKEKYALIESGVVNLNSGLNYNKNSEYYYNEFTVYPYDGIIGPKPEGSVLTETEGKYYKIFSIKPARQPKTISGNVSTKGTATTQSLDGSLYKYLKLNEDSTSNNWIATNGATTNLYTFVDKANSSGDVITYVPNSDVTFRLNIPRVARKLGWGWRFSANTAYDQPITLTTNLVSDNNIISTSSVVLSDAYGTYVHSLTLDEILRIVDGKTLYLNFTVQDIPAYSNTTPTVLARINWADVVRINKERRSVVG